MRLSVLTVLLGVILLVSQIRAGVVTGKVTGQETGEPLSGATVRVVGTSRSMLANDQGSYRIRLDPGSYQLKFSHVAHYSVISEIEVTEIDQMLNAELPSALIEVPGTTVYSRAYDPAQRIIMEAIRRKEEILSRLGSYDFDAYTRLVILDESKSDTESVVLITEMQMKGFWEQPDKYKEIITARKVSSNVQAEGTLVTIGEILNFNANRIEIDRYAVVSPTATDALDYYNYYLIDTVFIDDQLIFRLELEPKNNADPLFVGTIDIADSSFEVVGVDGSFSEGFETPFIDSLKYRQRCTQFDNEYWMPVEIGFSANIDLPIPGMPIYSADYVAALHNYSFEIEHEKDVFDYALEVDAEADDIDSATWHSGQLIPLTTMEQRGYERIDSVENAPKPLGKKLLRGAVRTVARALFDEDFFHFNRVEGAYLGYSGTQRGLIPRTRLWYKTGYAFDRQRWQHRYSLRFRLWQKRLLDIGLTYTDDILPVSSMITTSYNPTLMALFNKIDPLDYYRSRGVHAYTRVKLVNRIGLRVGYNDHRHYNEVNNTSYSFFRSDTAHRPNPEILEGTLRSGFARLVYDSRPVVKLKNEVVIFPGVPMTRLEFNVEYASPDFIDNDFDFVRYSLQLRRQQRTFGSGLTTIHAMVGGSERHLPPQRYFSVDFGDEFLSGNMNFKTLGEKNFRGSPAAYVYLNHDFGKWLFRRSGLPIVKSLPFSLSVYGGVFWTDLDKDAHMPGDDLIVIAPTSYEEIGFGLGQIPPIGLKLFFSWQLSNYNTNKFTLSVGGSFD
ncbi:MAG: DUF5686 and carboxypeptidase regulatory-like domain-containing protein [candidate division Zixibacteria bacterium]|nr:DUF5686 and carboxypeptidase regulatory-like domain-containing protein [candidate division Zixibacteria bacterium]MDH3935981.1 DUF5686 and carboxypeptidase regulatory-like domain-containing protein [candidate division Zixibacteria bacterium]MDH4032702.1 DUF5686 and carboxypeptidase regulatory-like domain-containing protein [candidate division Zixibacteria bacterium]